MVTLEIEKIGTAALAAVAARAPLRPAPRPCHVIQDRVRQKRWLAAHGFPRRRVSRGRVAATTASRRSTQLGRCFVKRRSGGYDGRGQVRVADGRRRGGRVGALGERPVRRRAGPRPRRRAVGARRATPAPGAANECVVYPAGAQPPRARDPRLVVLPAPAAVTLAAGGGGRAGIARALGIEGLLAVELFLLRDGRLLVNELAPRPHNTFHSTERGCATSQFEQLVRAVCDLPLGSTEMVRPAAIANLLGDLWERRHAGLRRALDGAGRAPAPLRQGVGATGPEDGPPLGRRQLTGDEALERVLRARDAMRIGA